jgi:hypothetical protein
MNHLEGGQGRPNHQEPTPSEAKRPEKNQPTLEVREGRGGVPPPQGEPAQAQPPVESADGTLPQLKRKTGRLRLYSDEERVQRQRDAVKRYDDKRIGTEAYRAYHRKWMKDYRRRRKEQREAEGMPREPGEATRRSRQPEQQTRPYHRRLKLERFGKGRDLAPYTPEEEAEIDSGVPEWEIQSRRIRDQSHSSPAPLSQEQQRKREKRLAYFRDYNLEHRAEKIEYKRRHYKYEKRKPYRQIRAEVEAQRQREGQAGGQPSEPHISQRDREQPDTGQIFPSAPKISH